jgi:hypothetical protein
MTNVADSSKEGYGSKCVVLSMTLMVVYLTTLPVSQTT